ncbi:4Fe-4S ferredoxin [Candidatus Acidianus copahuensis]|uniref:4Fe-4S ferredoxin n=1 Tax=Candidatus Acidianus copahuensis TaxID=1160895 RepID=A0A031LLA6_9CREN|nr:4Fe-4S ferredoxin [Candidatus Acidianus copahuensis]EZQ02014.1 4Fe-4S ferredoxin [Candidatus Acidianus copahuensis]
MLNVGLVVSKRSREIMGDEFLRSVFMEENLQYVAEIGEYIGEDIKSNDIRSIVLISENYLERLVESLEEAGIIPLAIEWIPLRWIEGKKMEYVKGLISSYVSKAREMDLVYRVQPVRISSVSRRSLLKFKLYEYRPYPILATESIAEKEVNRTLELCPVKALAKTPEGPQVSEPEKCVACGYCSGASYLGFLEVPNLSTEQVIEFINSAILKGEFNAILFTCSYDIEVPENIIPLRVPCIASIHDSFIMASYAAGLQPILYLDEKCENKEIGRKRLEEIPDYFPGTNLPIIKVQDKLELNKVNFRNLPKTGIDREVVLSRSRRRALYLWAIREMSKKVKLDLDATVPGIFNVKVDSSKCVLCGVCVRSCQMMVPNISNIQNSIQLIYDIPYCIGSERCIKNCPEKAITLEGYAKISDLKKVTYNISSLAKCKYCGKPLGSSKVKARVDELLESFGFNLSEYTNVCNECKQKILSRKWLEKVRTT